jgi:hypothetical protein
MAFPATLFRSVTDLIRCVGLRTCREPAHWCLTELRTSGVHFAWRSLESTIPMFRCRSVLGLGLMLFACSSGPSHDAAKKETGSTVQYEPEPTPKRFPCYDDRRNAFGGQLKIGRSFDREDVVVLTSLYREVVVEDLLASYDRHHTIHEIVVTFASTDEYRISPSEGFLASISTDSLIALQPGTYDRDYFGCELRLWGWIKPDTAKVEATIVRYLNPGIDDIIGRSALVVREGGHWTTCPSRAVTKF